MVDETSCRSCGSGLDDDVPGWCATCGTHHRVGARTLVDWLVSDVVDVDVPAGRPDPLGWPDHDALRDRAAADAEVDESVLVVRGRVDGGPEAVVVAWEFGFLGGSMGSVAGARIATAFDHARDARLPVVLLPSTGGARMQEGMRSLVQMAATTAAATRHADAGLLQVAVLRDPTTGGVFASHANLADVVWAEPGATIGFAGPRVAEALSAAASPDGTGGRLPAGSHTARGAKAAGLVDDVVARFDLPRRLVALLGWPGAATPTAVPLADGDRVPAGDPWTEVERARAADRARTPALLDAPDVLTVVDELRGDRGGDDDPSVRVALAALAGRPVVVVGMDPGAGRLLPGGYRKAWRGLDLAARLHVPVVTLVDTPGADASAASEAGGIAHHIAATFRRLLTVPTPVVSLVVGEGGSGGALALAVGDRLLIQEHAMFSVIAPEGAAAILHRDASRAADVAALLDPTATRLRELGIADEVVPEPVGAEVTTAWAAVARHLDELGTTADVDARLDRWRAAGTVAGS